jgi:type I restriction enzyme S subunit
VPTEAELARAQGREYEAADVLLARIKKERKSNTKGKYIEMQTLDISDLHQLPEGWLWVQAQDVCNWITNGYTPKADKMFQGKGEIPFIKVYNLTNNGELNFSINPTFISKETHTKELLRSNVFPGDILMNIVGPPLGKVSKVPDIFPEWNINQAIVIYRPLEGYERKFLLYSLLTNKILSWAIKRSKATAGQFNLTITICRNLPLPFPPLAEQRRIVAEVERRLSVSDKMEVTIKDSQQKAESLRQSILKKAFEGKLLNKKELEKVRKAPDWEPAEKLLEKIRQEKQIKENNNKTGRRK